MSIKWALIFLALFAVASIGVGFVKGALQQRKINKEAAKNAPPVEKSSGKDGAKDKSSGKDDAEKSADKKPEKKPEKKPKKKPEVKKPKRLDGGSAEKPDDEPKNG